MEENPNTPIIVAVTWALGLMGYFGIPFTSLSTGIISLVLGIGVDFFSDSGGIHTFSILIIAYARLFFVKLYFRKIATDYAFFKLKSEPFGKRFNYVVTLTLIHHLIYFSFANFSLQNFSEVILNTLFSSIFTLILYFLGSYIFTKIE